MFQLSCLLLTCQYVARRQERQLEQIRLRPGQMEANYHHFRDLVTPFVISTNIRLLG